MIEQVEQQKVWDINSTSAFKIHQAIGKMIITDREPYSVVEKEVKEELRVQQTREEIKKRPIMNKRKLQQNKKNQISEESNRVTKKNKIKRQLYAEKDICVMCGEAGRDNEMWFRCRNCAKWAHELCTSVSSAVDYICEFCIHE
ncbi:hypothetical protein HELRODRAFT_167927 [Helobdella robusta]|uniref:Zinc finger PHD-type domain-containing protein n=1 Tax=Helobdella robusta TaxID=6412 RepID=T1EZZ1_HELRO|nr:hypothetical protein HELRODRAFT_167927 [Helobdella robusta]ESO10079.1 hypothetical protein HELRODRAFT_167927 [Helobdella robusta]